VDFFLEFVDALLIEADGSRGKSLKGYTEHEPVLRERDRVIISVGLDVLDKPLCDDTVHRSHIVSALLSLREGDLIRPSHVADLILQRKGYLARAGAAEKTVVLGRISEDWQHEGAEEISRRIASSARRTRSFSEDRFLVWMRLQGITE